MHTRVFIHQPVLGLNSLMTPRTVLVEQHQILITTRFYIKAQVRGECSQQASNGELLCSLTQLAGSGRQTIKFTSPFLIIGGCWEVKYQGAGLELGDADVLGNLENDPRCWIYFWGWVVGNLEIQVFLEYNIETGARYWLVRLLESKLGQVF